MMNRSAEGGERSSPPVKGEGVSHSLHCVKVIADSTVRMNSDVTSGEPVKSAGGACGKRPYKRKREMASEASSAVGRSK